VQAGHTEFVRSAASSPAGTRWPPPAWTGPCGYGPFVNRPDAGCLASSLLTRSELTQATGHGPPPHRMDDLRTDEC